MDISYTEGQSESDRGLQGRKVLMTLARQNQRCAKIPGSRFRIASALFDSEIDQGVAAKLSPRSAKWREREHAAQLVVAEQQHKRSYVPFHTPPHVPRSEIPITYSNNKSALLRLPIQRALNHPYSPSPLT